jgi:hypothetical protein
MARVRERVDLLGLDAGAHRRGQRLGKPAGPEPVAVQLRRGASVGGHECGIDLERLRQGQMQRDAFARQQIRCQRLLEQRVPEGVVVLVVSHEHVVGQRRAQRVMELPLRQVADRRQEAMGHHARMCGRHT